MVNLPKRLRTVGEKMNLAVSLAAHDLLSVWDDDDIYLPHRLAFSVARLDAGKGFLKPERAWVLSDGALSGPMQNLFHVGSCWTRRLFDAVGGYPAAGSGYDYIFEERLRQRFPGAIAPYDIRPEDIYYLYRGGTGSYHMSAFGGSWGENVGHREVAEHVERDVAEGVIVHGRIRLEPQWRHDYPRLVEDRLRALSAAAPAPG